MTKKVKLIVGCQAVNKPDLELESSVKEVIINTLSQCGYAPENIRTDEVTLSELTFVEFSADIEVVNGFSAERKTILNSLMNTGRRDINSYVGWLVQIEAKRG